MPYTADGYVPDAQDDWFAQNAPPTTSAQWNPADPHIPDDYQYGSSPAIDTYINQNSGGTYYANQPGGAPPPGGTRNLQTDWPGIIAGLTPGEKNGASLVEAANRLKAKGYDARPADADPQGRNQGMWIDGKLYRVFDSSDRWTLVEGEGAWGAEPGGGGGMDPNTIGSLLQPYGGTAPTLEQPGEFAYPDFQMPTGEEVLKADPGHAFRVGQGEKALLGNRAMRGLLNGGDTGKLLLDYNQNAASQEYANFFDRSLSSYKTNLGTRKDTFGLNRDRLSAAYDARYKQYLDQYNMFRTRQQDTNQYITQQQSLGIQANQ